MNNQEALQAAVMWAARAERAAKNYPSIPSSEILHVQVAMGMSTMYAKLSQELYGVNVEERDVEDLQLPDPL